MFVNICAKISKIFTNPQLSTLFVSTFYFLNNITAPAAIRKIHGIHRRGTLRGADGGVSVRVSAVVSFDTATVSAWV